MHESEKWKWSGSVVSDSSDPMDCSLPGSSIHGIFQARVLEWVAIAFSLVPAEELKDIVLHWIYSLRRNKDPCPKAALFFLPCLSTPFLPWLAIESALWNSGRVMDAEWSLLWCSGKVFKAETYFLQIRWGGGAGLERRGTQKRSIPQRAWQCASPFSPELKISRTITKHIWNPKVYHN